MASLSHRRWLLGFLGLALIAIPSSAFAQELGAQTGIMTSVSVLIGIVMTVMNVLMWVLFLVLEVLLDPSFIFNTGGNLLNLLHEIWQFSRDLMNLVFAILLVVGAVYMVVTANNEKVKTMMPKFVMTVVIVNLSWFIPRVVYDVSQVAAYTVFQIPTILNQTGCKVRVNGGLQECKIVQGIVFFQYTNGIADGQLQAGGTWSCPLRPLICFNWVPISQAQGITNRTQILNGLIINHARLSSLASVPATAGQGGGGAFADIGLSLMFLVKLLMLVLIQVSLFFPLAALVVMLFIRIPVLWLTMAFMPFVSAHFVLPSGLFKDFDPWEKIWKQFLNAAFLPTLVAVPYTIGFIMLNAAAQMQEPVNGPFAAQISLLDGVNTFWQLLWLLMSIFIMWIGVFSVLKNAKLAGDFGGSIVSAIEGMGKATAKLPLALPIIPIPKLGGGSEKRSITGIAGDFDPRRTLAGLKNKEAAGHADADAIAKAGKVIQHDSKITADINTHIKTQIDTPGGIPDAQLRQIVEAIRTKAPNSSEDAILAAMLNNMNVVGGARRQQFIDEAKKKLHSAGPAAPAAPAAPAGAPAAPHAP